MPAENLKASLKQLHANLEATENVDPELKDLLHLLESDIQQLLSKEEQNASEANALAEQAQAVSAKFAVQHPRIETVLRELGNILASMGI